MFFKMSFNYELYLHDINRQDIPEEVHLMWVSISTVGLHSHVCHRVLGFRTGGLQRSSYANSKPTELFRATIRRL